MTISSTSTIPVAALRDRLEGRVIGPGDADYDQARQVFSGAIDRRPAAIARVADADDVARVIAFARATGAELAVRGGGHSAAGHSVSEGGIVLDLADMRELAIDPEARTAWAGAGLTAGEYTDAADEHGLATGFGDTASVGIGGITLSGGVGFLVRKHGLTVDSLLGAEVVTADGDLLRVDAGSHPDLFWALRGGGGNFGVVTRLHYRLHPVGTMFGGILILPATTRVIESFVAAADAAPEELSGIANVMPAPPLPFLPESQHGRLVVFAMLAYAGDPAEGERALAPFREIDEPLADMLRPMRYPEMFPPEPEDYRPSAIGRTAFLDGVDLGAAEEILAGLREGTGAMNVVQLRVLGGAMRRVPADATAFAHRDARLMVNVAAIYERPEQKQAQQAWVEDLAERLNPAAGAYVGFLDDEGDERVRAAYPGATWERLAAVKAKYDPDNVFRLNQNIRAA
jgi:FAD/FMN-containing dehydrogenase